MRAFASLVLVVMSVLLLCAGCTAQLTRESAPTVRTPAIVAFNVSEDPHSLDPLVARSDDERQLMHLTFDMLLDVDARGRAIPALAAQVPSVANGGVSADGRTITYHLRHDVRWQDGAPFTSRDVRFTWRAVTDPHSEITSTRGYDLIESIATPDRWTAVVRLKQPWAPAVQTLFTYGSQPVPILPAHLLEGAGSSVSAQFSLHPLGTGPYVLERWERATRLIYRANNAYYKGRPRTPTVAVMVVPDFNTDLTLLRAHDLDWSLLSPAQRLSLGTTSDLRFIYVPFAGFGALTFNVRRPPFDDVRMRRAIAQSIDRARLSSAITRGQYPVTDSDQPPFSWAYDSTARMPSYDPRAADRLFDELGWVRGSSGMRERQGVRLAFTFAVFPEGDTAVRTAEYVQEMLAARGIAVSIKRITLAHFYLPESAGGLLMSGNYDVAYFAWRTGEDPDDSDIVTCGGASNYAGYCSPQLDRLEQAALTSTSLAQRTALYARIQQMLARDVPYLFLYAPTYGYALTPALRGFSPTPFSPTRDAWRWAK